MSGDAHPNERRAVANANRVHNNLEVQYRKDGVGRRNNEPIAHRATSGRLAYIAGDWKVTAWEAGV